MKAALLFGIRDLRIVEIPKPKCEPDGLIVRVSACGICPTDIRKYLTLDHGSLHLPMNLGHEWVGVIDEVGPQVCGFHSGMRIIGDTYDGYAEYAALGSETLRTSFPNGPLSIPSHVSDEELTFVEPLADCIHAVIDQAQVHAGDTVVIIGAGQMGLQLTAVAALQGATVIVSEPQPLRREMALEFGATHTIDPKSNDVLKEVMALTGGQGVQSVIVSIGDPSLVNLALEMLANRGRAVLFGGFPRPARADFDPNLIHYKELTLTGSEWIGVPPHHRPELYQSAVNLIAEQKVPVKRLITACFPFSRIHEAFDAALDPSSLKIIVRMEESAM